MTQFVLDDELPVKKKKGGPCGHYAQPSFHQEEERSGKSRTKKGNQLKINRVILATFGKGIGIISLEGEKKVLKEKQTWGVLGKGGLVSGHRTRGG